MFSERGANKCRLLRGTEPGWMFPGESAVVVRKVADGDRDVPILAM
jgi:hypothetical protein